MTYYRIYDNRVDDLSDEGLFTNACTAVKVAVKNPDNYEVYQYTQDRKGIFKLVGKISQEDYPTILRMEDEIAEILGYIAGGPFKWADFDLILIYLADAGYEYDKRFYPYLKEQLDSKAKHIHLPDISEFYMGG